MRIALAVFLLVNSSVVFSQSNYYVTDTALVIVDKLRDNGPVKNAMFCTVIFRNKIEQFTPDQISEYGFKNGKTYISKEITLSNTVQRVFLERLVKGKIKFYVFTGKRIKLYYLELRDSTLIEITQDNFHSTLVSECSDCPLMSEELKQVRFNRFSLSNFIAHYNDCKQQYFPVFKLGAIVSTGFQTLTGYSKISNPALNKTSLKYKINYSAGAFMEFPLISNTISLNIDFLYATNSYTSSVKLNNLEVDYILNSTSVSTPLFLRYAFKSKARRSFVSGGFIYSYQIKNENNTYASTTFPDHTELSKIDYTAYNSKHQLGIGIGGGQEFKLNYKHKLVAEIRLNKSAGISKISTLRKSEIILLLGLNF